MLSSRTSPMTLGLESMEIVALPSLPAKELEGYRELQCAGTGDDGCFTERHFGSLFPAKADSICSMACMLTGWEEDGAFPLVHRWREPSVLLLGTSRPFIASHASQIPPDA